MKELWIHFGGISGRNPARNSGSISDNPLEEILGGIAADTSRKPPVEIPGETLVEIPGTPVRNPRWKPFRLSPIVCTDRQLVSVHKLENQNESPKSVPDGLTLHGDYKKLINAICQTKSRHI